MDVKYQIFISSTFQDLQEERRILMEQILNLGHIPVGMELFQAANQEQWTYIKKRILTCDYYLLVVAERYGSIGSEGKSYTRMEYEFAIANAIPVASFLLDDAVRGSRRADFVEHNRREEIEAFRGLCSANKMVKFWRDPPDLALKATNALLGVIEEEPRQGWVRADLSAEAAYRELAKLAEEKRDLQERLLEIENSLGLVVPKDISYHMEKMKVLTASDFVNAKDIRLESFESRNLLDFFCCSKPSFVCFLHSWRATMGNSERCKAHPHKGSHLFAREINSEYAAYGIIDVSMMVKGDSALKRYRMSEYGQKLLMHAERALEARWEKEAEETSAAPSILTHLRAT
jgi:hypothetical protein